MLRRLVQFHVVPSHAFEGGGGDFVICQATLWLAHGTAGEALFARVNRILPGADSYGYFLHRRSAQPAPRRSGSFA